MNYEEVVKMIEESNQKVDEVLKAARLQRNQKSDHTVEIVKMIFDYALGTVAIIAGAILIGLMMFR